MGRRLHLRSALVATAATSYALVAFVACSDDLGHPPFTSDAEADAAALPDTSTPTPERDAGPSTGFDASAEPVVCAVTPCVVELAAGANHVCARMAGGDVRCWGDNVRGSVGNGEAPADAGKDGGGKDDAEETNRPVAVTDLARATRISAARDTTCARRDDGAVLCWGGNERGQLGLEESPAAQDNLAHPYATRVAAVSGATRIDVGQRSACAVLATGELSCWGANDKKQLARAGKDAVLGPGVSDLAGFKVARAAASEGTTYGMTADARLLSWGALGGRQGSLDPDPIPAPIPTLSGVHDVAVGPTHACAIANGSVYCWGSSKKYALCTGLPSAEPLPAHALLQSTAYPQQIAVSRNSTCVRLTDGTLQCCGDATRGQLAIPAPDGGTGSMFSFTPASGFKGYAVQVVTTEIATCALLRTGAVECWGGNDHGELGQGTRDTDPHPSPAAVSFQ